MFNYDLLTNCDYGTASSQGEEVSTFVNKNHCAVTFQHNVWNRKWPCTQNMAYWVQQQVSADSDM